MITCRVPLPCNIYLCPYTSIRGETCCSTFSTHTTGLPTLSYFDHKTCIIVCMHLSLNYHINPIGISVGVRLGIKCIPYNTCAVPRIPSLLGRTSRLTVSLWCVAVHVKVSPTVKQGRNDVRAARTTGRHQLVAECGALGGQSRGVRAEKKNVHCCA